MIQTAEQNSIANIPSYERLHSQFFIGKHPCLQGKGPNNSIMRISIYSLKLDFYIVELQMRGISLFSFSKRANELLISEKRVFSHFVRQTREHPTLLPSSSAQRLNKEEIGKMRKHLVKINEIEMSKLALLQQTNITQKICVDINCSLEK